MTPPTFHVSLFRGLRDAIPKAAALPLSELWSLVWSPRHCTDKEHGDYWSPCAFPPGARRARGNVQSVCALVLDYDGGYPYSALPGVWAGWAGAAYTTFSHGLEGRDRFRVVLPLASPVAPPTFARLWLWAWERSGHAIDPACKDPSRMWLLPSRRPGGAVWTTGWPGPLLDAGALDLPEIETRPPRPPAPPAKVSPHMLAAEWKRRCMEDPDTRRRIADTVGAQVVDRDGPVAIRGRCPSCGDASVWWRIDPERLRRARCNHRATCGWEGHLWEIGSG